MSNYKEQTLTCADCGRDFSFSERDQELYRGLGFEPPKRCKDCRDAKKALRREGAEGATRERLSAPKGVVSTLSQSER